MNKDSSACDIDLGGGGKASQNKMNTPTQNDVYTNEYYMGLEESRKNGQ
jgi:hypothetical protein